MNHSESDEMGADMPEHVSGIDPRDYPDYEAEQMSEYLSDQWNAFLDGEALESRQRLQEDRERELDYMAEALEHYRYETMPVPDPVYADDPWVPELSTALTDEL